MTEDMKPAETGETGEAPHHNHNHNHGAAMATMTSNDISHAGSDSRTLPMRSKANDKSAAGKPATVEDEDHDHDHDHDHNQNHNHNQDSIRAESEAARNGIEIENLEEQDYGEISNLPPTQAKKKKKKAKRRPQSQRGLGKPTGFEDFFADAPMTPAQHAEEQQLYDRDLPFVDRILTAIGRFERTRKMSNERRDVLYKYLVYGGVEVGPNSFQGGQNTEDMDKPQVAATLTQASVSDDKRDLGTATSLYEVDFLGCMKGFLSRRAKYLYGFETRDQVSTVASTLERFMDYLLQHDVCPEFRDHVLATRNLCREVPLQLWNVAEATRRLPGDFNIACSTLFGGSYAHNYDGETWWGPESTSTTTEDQVFVGMKPEEAAQIVHFGVAAAAPEHIFTAYLAGLNGNSIGSGDGNNRGSKPTTTTPTLEVEWVREHVGFEITNIIPPTAEGKRMYIQNSRHFRPVGRVYAKPWKNPDSLPEDLTAVERASEERAAADDEERKKKKADDDDEKEEEKEEYIFFIESILQSYLQVGMRIEATVRKLNCGLMFFDDLIDVFPTFDEFLLNDMIHQSGWKKPKPIKGAFDYVEEGGYEDEFNGEDKSDNDDDVAG